MLNQVKLTGTVKYATDKSGKRLSQERNGKDGETFWSHLLTVVTDQNGQGVNYISVSYTSNEESPVNDGKTYDVSGYIRSWKSGDKYGQTIEAKRFSPVSRDEVQRRKDQVNEILSGSATF